MKENGKDKNNVHDIKRIFEKGFQEKSAREWRKAKYQRRKRGTRNFLLEPNDYLKRNSEQSWRLAI